MKLWRWALALALLGAVAAGESPEVSHTCGDEQVSFVNSVGAGGGSAYGTDSHIYVRDRNLDSYTNCGGYGIVWSTAHLAASTGVGFAETGYLKDLRSNNSTKWFRGFEEYVIGGVVTDVYYDSIVIKVFSTFRVSNTLGTDTFSFRIDDDADGNWDFTGTKCCLGWDHGVAKGETGRRPEDGLYPAAADEQKTLLYRTQSGTWNAWEDNNANSAAEDIPWWSPTRVAADHFTVDQCGSQSC